MPSIKSVNLTPDDIDDLLYFTRTNSSRDLQESLQSLSTQSNTSPKQILEACIDPENGNTVLHYCSANGHSELLSEILALIAKGPTFGSANPEQAEQQSTSSEGGEQSPTTAKSALINHRNAQGNTPLHWAAYNGHVEVVRKLLGVGADMWVKNAAGHLAMFEAERADRGDVVKILLEEGGREVERVGTEGAVAKEDLADIDEAEKEGGVKVVAGPSKDAGGEDVDMGEG